MTERHVEMADIHKVIGEPDEAMRDESRRGRLLSKYLSEWDRILVVAIEERPSESIVLVKTILWSEAN